MATCLKAQCWCRSARSHYQNHSLTSDRLIPLLFMWPSCTTQLHLLPPTFFTLLCNLSTLASLPFFSISELKKKKTISIRRAWFCLPSSTPVPEEKGLDYLETFARVARYGSLRVFLFIAATRSYEIKGRWEGVMISSWSIPAHHSQVSRSFAHYPQIMSSE